MRKLERKDGLTVQAIAGTHVVLLAMNMKKASCKGLRGFALHRTDHTEGEAYWLQGQKTFEQTDPGLAAGAKHSTRQHPIQDFAWSDYSAKPGHRYTYRVLALKGPLDALQLSAEVSVTITTESPEGGDHDIYFNRGAAASQEFARRFGNKSPGVAYDPKNPMGVWLSRGNHEAILDFVRRAKGKGWGLRVCAYEFRLPSALKAIREAQDLGADVEVLYDAGKEFPRDENRKEVAAAKFKEGTCTERLPKPAALSHNKFIVLTKGGKGVAVLTGSTNFSEGGVFGQSNVVHVVEDPKVAEEYLAAWSHLAGNPHRRDLSNALTAPHAIVAEGLPPKGTTMVFSPRSDKLTALDFYGRLASSAKDALFMTFAFGMHETFKAAYRSGKAPLRYALFEKLLGPGVRKEQVEAATKEMTDLRKMPENRFAVGSQIKLNLFDKWVAEKLTGYNSHVKYVHTKYMIVDPLGPDPIVVTGSANFSKASTDANDENMLVIRGNKRVADIYLGEFMRLWDHHAFREWAARRAKEEGAAGARKAADKPGHLDETDEWWRRRFDNFALSAYRNYFAPMR